ncbi:YybH family protein [Saccharopolyspora hattusasensis]|uniref:YybH family protein n=1 Tax=Saccharopolyspora hattusasensis TaxID=1128679 RepID=UPI003D97A14F
MTPRPENDWTRFSQRISAAAEAFASGDPAPYQELWAKDDDVCLMGAFGGTLVGWSAVQERMNAVSAMVSAGPAVLHQDVVAEFGSAGVMCSVRLERFQPRDGGPESTRRLTLTARHDGTGWHIVHQHSDSLTVGSA